VQCGRHSTASGMPSESQERRDMKNELTAFYILIFIAMLIAYAIFAFGEAY
jgi:hypothetical protein